MSYTKKNGNESAAYEKWKKAYCSTSKRKERFVTTSSDEIKELYIPSDTDGMDYEADLGYPGQFPFTRGVYPTMYRDRLWTMRQFAGFGTALDTNKRFRYLLDSGQTGLSVAFDFPTLLGYDSDNPLSRGEVGVCGVAIDSLADMERLFECIPLDKVSTSMTINGPAPIMLAFYVAAAEKQGVSSKMLTGTLQNDILKEYQAQHCYCFPPRPSLRLIIDLIAFCSEEVPKWNTISISGYHIREAGSTALQELAFTLANGFTYVEESIKAGMDVDTFAPRLSFFFNAHNDLFEEIAKYRAARRIWARRMRDKYNAKDPRSWLMRFHTQTAGCSLTAQQPENNIARVTIQALAATLGGTQSLHTNSMDETLALPTEKSALIALRTQQIIAHESGIPNSIDPLAGSYFVESLTNKMEKGAEDYFRQIESIGGVVSGIESGWFFREIARSASRYQNEIDNKERIIVGVNGYVLEDEKTDIPILKIDQKVQDEQIDRLNKMKKNRDNNSVAQALNDLRQCAESDGNTFPELLNCTRNYCTIGEIVGTLKEVFGEWHAPNIF
ncbi:methylmalonyl-CoA mutase [candidate division KSB1 bacterium]